MPAGRGGRFGGVPPRDAAPAPTGTARITGRVIAADSGTPLRRAQVNLSSRDAGVNRGIATDSDGRFDLTALPAGRYRLFVAKAGYVSLEYGQARPFEAGKPIDLTDGQVLERVDFGLPRGGAITGRIMDEFGDAITDVQVQAMRYQFVNGERQLVEAGRAAQTNDLGEYRIFGLMPGEYIVRASGRAGPPGPRDSNSEPVGYPGTYYPGVTNVGEAQAVTLGLGQELTSIAFGLVPARLARVSGTVTSSSGRPLPGAVVMLRPRTMGVRAGFRFGGNNQVRADGTFRLTDVPPGEYLLEVQQRPQPLRDAQGLDLSQLEFASMPISIDGDIEGVSVVTAPGVTLTGRIVSQGQKMPVAPQVVALPASGSGPPVMAFAARALGGGRVAADGTFTIRGLAGSQFIRVQGLPSGWALKSVTIDGTDVTDAPFDFRPGHDLANATITLTDRLTTVTGNVRDPRGQPVIDYVAVLFAEDAKRWGQQSRYVQAARPNQNGTFSVTGLPPGRYLAAALPALETGLQNDPALLERLRAVAQELSLSEGQSANLNLEMPSEQP